MLQKFAVFEDEVAKRQLVASWYADVFGNSVVTPIISSGNTSVYGQYTVRVTDRDHVQAALADQGIPTAVHYPKGLHQQPALQPYIDDEITLPHTEQSANEVMSLPFHPYMQQVEVAQVAQGLIQSLAQGVIA